MNVWKHMPTAMVCIATVASAVPAGEPNYTLARFTVIAGGTTSSGGGDYQMSSTIGQALSHEMEGGLYSLDGGYWYGIASGDCGADGYVDLVDHLQFFDCVTGPDVETEALECQCYDVNLSGSIDLLDFADVQAAFTGS